MKKASKKARPATSGKTLVATDPNLNHEEQAAVSAVKEYQTAEKTIELFKQDNQQLMTEYLELLEEKEQKRQVADKLIRALDVSFGPWDRYSERTTYNADMLCQLIGKQKFMELGGVESTAVVYSIDGQKVELAIASGAIPKEVVPEVKTVTSSYHTPK